MAAVLIWTDGPSAVLLDSEARNTTADAGNIGFGITMVYFINKHWFLTADGALKRLLGSAAASPITQEKTNGVCDISVNYQF